jgi:hypothetical protein
MRLLPFRICLSTKLGFYLAQLPKGEEWKLIFLFLLVSPLILHGYFGPRYSFCAVSLMFIDT